MKARQRIASDRHGSRAMRAAAIIAAQGSQTLSVDNTAESIITTPDLRRADCAWAGTFCELH
ncbi:MAG: hypothetical protein IT492_13935 [Gammaproteobacteria bacterium]|nr:hypothetical protein [Gammaproteobacteria bacterium]